MRGICSDPIKEKERIAKARLTWIGRKHTPESILKMSEIKRGTKRTETALKKTSESMLLYYSTHPEAIIKKREIRCGYKQSEETRKKIGLAHKGRTFSEETLNKMSEAQKGDKSPQWKGGISFEPYCQKFNNKFKERVRAFFGYQCQECGHVWHEGEIRLAVHHVNFRKDSCCAEDVIPLFVPLCSHPCHSKTNHNRFFWAYWFTEMINRIYDGKCYYTNEGRSN